MRSKSVGIKKMKSETPEMFKDSQGEKLSQVIDPEKDKEAMYLDDARQIAKKSIVEQLIELEEKVTALFGKNFAKDCVSAIINRVMIMHEGMRVLDPTNNKDQYLLLKNTTLHTKLAKRSDMDDLQVAI